MESTASLPWHKKLHWQILLAMLAGTVAGLIGGEGLVPYVGWLGELFIKLLKMIIVPLVFTSIVSGVASVGGGRDLGRMFGKTLGYYVLSSLLAALTGLLLVNAIAPGVGATFTGVETKQIPELETPSSAKDLLLDVVPENVVEAAAAPNMLAVIFFCILLGASDRQPARTSPAETLTDPVQSALFPGDDEAHRRGDQVSAPIGVFALITRVVGKYRLAGRSSHWALYMLTIASGLTTASLHHVAASAHPVPRSDPTVRVHFRNMNEPLADRVLDQFVRRHPAGHT